MRGAVLPSKHDGRNHYETNDLCKSCNSIIVSFAHFILIIKHVLYSHELKKKYYDISLYPV